MIVSILHIATIVNYISYRNLTTKIWIKIIFENYKNRSKPSQSVGRTSAFVKPTHRDGVVKRASASVFQGCHNVSPRSGGCAPGAPSSPLYPSPPLQSHRWLRPLHCDPFRMQIWTSFDWHCGCLSCSLLIDEGGLYEGIIKTYVDITKYYTVKSRFCVFEETGGKKRNKRENIDWGISNI